MTDQIDPGLVSALNEFALGNRIGLSMTVLPLFEYVITIDLEVATVWRRKFTVPSLLLITTRWNMVLGALLFFWPTPSVKLYHYDRSGSGFPFDRLRSDGSILRTSGVCHLGTKLFPVLRGACSQPRACGDESFR
ncbi:hypothetical protein PsYK624_145040 [Phanerochaete sordida]|uniref:DUF6533 domain-containing protein n=1 Tax=Phanerochaete sordida TaxID=48140 RepID=A0A9P3LK86_9APHY|nr:hypothetical protein PsYK624_145040 [Phanerochaete sordida]